MGAARFGQRVDGSFMITGGGGIFHAQEDGCAHEFLLKCGGGVYFVNERTGQIEVEFVLIDAEPCVPVAVETVQEPEEIQRGGADKVVTRKTGPCVIGEGSPFFFVSSAAVKQKRGKGFRLFWRRGKADGAFAVRPAEEHRFGKAQPGALSLSVPHMLPVLLLK